MKRLGLLALVLFGALLLWRLLPDPPRESPNDTGFSVTGVLSGEEDIAGYARVTGPEPLVFPRDHGAHPRYRHEWWYVTGNLKDEAGRHLGYQITFFRFNVAPDAPSRRSALATNQVWMAHLGLTDTDAGRFHHGERLSRGAAGLAGAVDEPFRVWLDDWVLESVEPDTMMPLRLRARHTDVELELVLRAEKSLVLQGDQGYSRKGSDPGNASRYYSFTRLATDGRVTVDGQARTVIGSSWMDREWGTSTLESGQVGWDWFSLQLDNQREIMFYHLRRDDGGIDPRSKGLLVKPDGRSRVLALDAVSLEATRYWESPDGKARYPVAWRLRIPDEDLDLVLDARLDDQELRTGFRYWEGAIRARGSQHGEAVEGVGYAELTGYAQ